MLIEIEHELRFEYDDFVHESFMELRVEPLTDARQTLRSFYLAVGPPTQVGRYSDWNGNRVHHFGVTDFHDRIEVLVRSAVSVEPVLVNVAGLGDPVRDGGGAAMGSLGPLIDFLALGGPVERSGELERLADTVTADEGAPAGNLVAAAGRQLFERFEYRQGVTDYRSTTQRILEQGGGVCQDFAHLMLGVLRLRGVPARYVSGYMHLESGSGEPPQSHAWIEAHVAGYGWVGFDPTHDRVPDERYVTVARGRHYDDVAPNRGIYRGSAHEILHTSVATRVAPPKDVASLQEEIGQIDVPVYREQPRDEPGDDGQEAAQQQQQ